MFLQNLFSNKEGQNVQLSEEELLKVLRISPEMLDKFEHSYKAFMSDKEGMEPNAKLAVKSHKESSQSALLTETDKINNLVDRIVNELIVQTQVLKFDGKTCKTIKGISADPVNPVSFEEIMALPEYLRPQLTGFLMQKDIADESAGRMLLTQYLDSCDEALPEKTRKTYYNLFRQGLDILDLDWLSYRMIDTNVNSMGHWLPQISKAIVSERFFQIPKTTIIKVPITLLQLTHIQWETLTQTTLDVVNKYCMKVFELDIHGDYFIKTGTYSSKFDFRNAHVTTTKEVQELGSYLLYIHYAALLKAGPLYKPCVYGISTTTEWVVRDFIKDPEDNLTIYHGLPLRTEYRAFVDFDTKTVLGITPYWDVDVMGKHFKSHTTKGCTNPDQLHDYITFSMNEESLMERFTANKDIVISHLEEVIKTTEGLSGQWSVDIMQNGDQFYLIDMATAATSALKEKINYDFGSPKEDWMPIIDRKE